jgi:hypothetical protein
MKKIFLLASIFALLCTITLNAQVTIGDLKPPHASSILQVVSLENNKGVLVPEMTEAQRDAIKSPADGLLIYNTDENCFNYYSATDAEWKSMCGGIAKSTVSLSCDDPVMVYGSCMQGAPLTTSNYLVMTVNVEKPGAYTITATTNNGYGYNASGTFLNKGLQQVTLTGQGSPTASSDPGDVVSFTLNGSEATYASCPTPATVVIPVAPANPTYTMECVSGITVNGTYYSGVSLKASNNITVNVDVSALGNGEWTASTNTVDGISFSGNGVFVATGPNTITLNGYGTPTSAKTKTMTITLNSTGIAKTCTATVNCVFTSKKILVMGYAPAVGGADPDIYGYALTGNRASYDMVMATVNYGTTATSTVKVQGLTINGLSGSTLGTSAPIMITAVPTDAGLSTALATNPDIVIIGWGMAYTSSIISQFTDYLNNGGVMIIMNKYSSTGNATTNSEASFFTSLFGTAVTAATITNSTGTVIGATVLDGSLFKLASISGDPILNGPFGSLNGLLWGNDYYPATYMKGIPDSQIITYSGANNATGGSNTGVTMFRHKTLNLFWVGDGGFVSNEYTTNGSYPSTTIEPFATNSSNVPIARTGFGTGATYGGTGSVCNSQLFANVLAWAIQQAENNGINKK